MCSVIAYEISFVIKVMWCHCVLKEPRASNEQPMKTGKEDSMHLHLTTKSNLTAKINYFRLLLNLTICSTAISFPG